ncbi:BON domain-containing protein [Legionella jordanis]|uniref:Hemolysin, lipoprotein n=1 Tax=Legionella jordanis TaxID=456 RepID=A0A0W0VCN0_9GAMM|nr:BON domain-containing protein [Legionella jordanis]KTD17892.1 hemolysin, lipoprotein [Legionella jordanis]RMX02409.1 BON domain-containing protein [Legionella jordanis]VEH14017.1 hemolysin, lipoprotein [Legionella jordanis]HAT8713862.1 BON domain-containing protein [Legionella jordanis]
MRKQGCVILALSLGCSLLTSCLSNVWTGAMLVYDRHNIYKKVSDYELSANVHHLLYEGTLFNQRNVAIDVAVFNGDILLAGHLPNLQMREEALRRVKRVSGYRRLFNELDISNTPGNAVQDSWITTKIRSRIFADSSIDPNIFKIVTADCIVYLMGDVPVEQANRVIEIARTTQGVLRVVTLLRLYVLKTT